MKRYLDLKMGGNLFSTTIHVLASGIRKLAPIQQKPEVLYRGLRDLNSIRSSFVQTGFLEGGYLERGFLSSTKSSEIAMYYAGCNQPQGKSSPGLNKRQPARIEICTRGPCDVMEFCASINFLSQSCKEESEYLFLPWTLLEFHEVYEESNQAGSLTVVKAHAKSRINILTTEEIAKVDTI
jgi:hypothetical protein